MTFFVPIQPFFSLENAYKIGIYDMPVKWINEEKAVL